jgi:hypothetical protein
MYHFGSMPFSIFSAIDRPKDNSLVCRQERPRLRLQRRMVMSNILNDICSQFALCPQLHRLAGRRQLIRFAL